MHITPAVTKLGESIRQEFTVEADGRAFASRRGIARLCGVGEAAIRKLLDRVTGDSCGSGAYLDTHKSVEPLTEQDFEGAYLQSGSGGDLELPKLFETFPGQDFEGGALIPDTLATCIIEYYALDAGRYRRDQARLVYRTFAAIGFHTWIQSELDWQQNSQQPPLPKTPRGEAEWQRAGANRPDTD